jgi:predicted CopG family antitoxin
VYLYYDVKASFLIKSETVKEGEKNSFSTIIYGEYKKFKKLTYFTTMRFGTDNDAQSAKIIELYYNEKVSEIDFK